MPTKAQLLKKFVPVHERIVQGEWAKAVGMNFSVVPVTLSNALEAKNRKHYACDVTIYPFFYLTSLTIRHRRPTLGRMIKTVHALARGLIEHLRALLQKGPAEARNQLVYVLEAPRAAFTYPRTDKSHGVTISLVFGIPGWKHMPGSKEEKAASSKRKINRDDKERMWSEIGKTGWEYTFDGYSDWQDVPDPKLHALIDAFNENPKSGGDAQLKLREYIWYKGCEG